ncbi:MAG: GAF domain-containing protein [Thermonemataceae bacterium]
MAEHLYIPTTKDRKGIYEAIIPQVEALINQETDLIANLANTTAVLKEAFSFFWVGFYLVKEAQLVLGPFQGPLACTRIAFGKGVCGTSYTQQKTLVVPDVEAFPGHIACSSLTQSEIVVPVWQEKKVVAILDIDSDQREDFDQVDQLYLEQIASLLGKTQKW